MPKQTWHFTSRFHRLAVGAMLTVGLLFGLFWSYVPVHG